LSFCASVIVFYYTRIERLVKGKHSSLLDPFISFKDNTSPDGATTLSITTLSIITFGLTIKSKTLRITTLSTMTSNTYTKCSMLSVI
jgi:hypothetical protein